MNIIRSSDLQFQPASHEDPKNPSVLKKVLFKNSDLRKGTYVQMVNWALLPKGRSFSSHYHEDMDEIFIIIKGEARIRIGEEEGDLREGDAVLVPAHSVHTMTSSVQDTEYLVVGLTSGSGGKTVILEPGK